MIDPGGLFEVFLVPEQAGVIGEVFGLGGVEAVVGHEGILGGEGGGFVAHDGKGEGHFAVDEEVVLDAGVLHLGVAVERRVGGCPP